MLCAQRSGYYKSIMDFTKPVIITVEMDPKNAKRIAFLHNVPSKKGITEFA